MALYGPFGTNTGIIVSAPGVRGYGARSRMLDSSLIHDREGSWAFLDVRFSLAFLHAQKSTNKFAILHYLGAGFAISMYLIYVLLCRSVEPNQTVSKHQQVIKLTISELYIHPNDGQIPRIRRYVGPHVAPWMRQVDFYLVNAITTYFEILQLILDTINTIARWFLFHT